MKNRQMNPIMIEYNILRRILNGMKTRNFDLAFSDRFWAKKVDKELLGVGRHFPWARRNYGGNSFVWRRSLIHYQIFI